jgi:hypothetical protein
MFSSRWYVWNNYSSITGISSSVSSDNETSFKNSFVYLVLLI